MTSFRAIMPPACIFFLVAFPCLAFAQAAKPVEKWEYGELHHYERSGSSAGPDKIFESSIDWISREGFVRSYGWTAMADKLKAPELKKDVIKHADKDTEKKELEGVHRLRCLNHLGDQGWELVSHERNNDNGESLWVFKRPGGR
jgi:hypothetical protein